MKAHSMEKLSLRRPTELVHAGNHRGWVRPAWLWSCALGSAAAMSISALAAVVVRTYLAQYRSGTHQVVGAELMALAAGLEGAVIGYFQWRVLRRLFPTMTSGPWVATTMIAAGSGCLLSWLPTSFALTSVLASRIGDVTMGPLVIARISLVTGALIGLVWGVAQYAVLRLHAHRAGSWIVASTMSWTVSFAWLYLAAFWPDRTVSPVIHVALGALAGLVFGLVSGLLQGHVLARLHSRLLLHTHPESRRKITKRQHD